jgi:hypothetical protein
MPKMPLAEYEQHGQGIPAASQGKIAMLNG